MEHSLILLSNNCYCVSWLVLHCTTIAIGDKKIYGFLVDYTTRLVWHERDPCMICLTWQRASAST